MSKKASLLTFKLMNFDGEKEPGLDGVKTE